jgi:hypothetical protein
MSRSRFTHTRSMSWTVSAVTSAIQQSPSLMARNSLTCQRLMLLLALLVQLLPRTTPSSSQLPSEVTHQVPDPLRRPWPRQSQPVHLLMVQHHLVRPLMARPQLLFHLMVWRHMVNLRTALLFQLQLVLQQPLGDAAMHGQPRSRFARLSMAHHAL